MVVDPNGPEVVEGPMIDVETSRIAADPTRSEEGVLSISSTIGDLLEFRSMSPPLPSDPETAAVAAPVAVGGVGPAPEMPPAEVAGRSSRPDEDLGRSDWGRARVYILAFTGLALGAYARCRGLVHRDGRRAAESDPCRAEPDAATAPSRRRGQEG